MKTTTGSSLPASAELFEQFEAGHVGEPEVEHDAVVFLAVDGSQRIRTGGDDIDVDVVMVEQSANA